MKPSQFKTFSIDTTGTLAVEPPKAAKIPKPVTPTASIRPDDATTLYAQSDDGVGHKQWSIWCDGANVTTEWGKFGGKLVHKTKTFRSPSNASWQMRHTIRAKRRKGYTDTRP
jgi:predicted DNA-binding WGR domain protein